MDKVKDILSGIAKYDKLTTFDILNVEKIEKESITSYISTPSYEKIINKAEQSINRYRDKVSEIEGKTSALKKEIDLLNDEINFRSGKSGLRTKQGLFEGIKSIGADTLSNTKPGMFDSGEEHNNKASKYNAVLDLIRRLEDKKERLVDKYNMAIEKLNERKEELEEKLEETKQESLSALDDDMLAFFGKSLKKIEILSTSVNASDVLSALELSFLNLKFNFIANDLIEVNSVRKEVTEIMNSVKGLVANIFGNDLIIQELDRHIKNILQFLSTIEALSINAKKEFDSISQADLKRYHNSFTILFEEEINTDFNFTNVIDPKVLNEIETKIVNTLEKIKDNYSKMENLIKETKDLNERSTITQSNVSESIMSLKNYDKELLGSMGQINFIFSLLDESISEELLSRDAQKKSENFRDQVLRLTGTADSKQYFSEIKTKRELIVSIEKNVKEANLSKIKDCISGSPDFLKKLSGLVSECEEKLKGVRQIPQENVKNMISEIKSAISMSYFPIIGIIGSFQCSGIFNKHKQSFESGINVYNEINDSLFKIFSKSKINNIIVGIIFSFFTFGGLVYGIQNKMIPENLLFGFKVFEYASIVSVGILLFYIINAIKYKTLLSKLKVLKNNIQTNKA